MHLVTLDAHLDGRNVALVRTALNEAFESAVGDVVVDMGALQLIDATGLGMLTAAHLRAERGGHRLVLRNCSKELRRVLAVTRLNRVLNLERDPLELSV